MRGKEFNLNADSNYFSPAIVYIEVSKIKPASNL